MGGQAATKGPAPAAAKSEVGSFPSMHRDSLFDLTGKVALVTGGGSGIGSMIARAFVDNGATVYIASRKISNLTATADALNAIRSGSCHCITADLSSKDGCDSLAKELSSRISRLDILVNNSGNSYGSSIDKVDETRGWDRVMAVNVKSLFYLTVALRPLLQVGKTDTEPASVINISSVYTFFPSAFQPTVPNGGATWSYGPSKAAASTLTKVLASKLMSEHITVNAILPGFVATPMTSYADQSIMNRAHPTGRMSGPVDMGGIALFLASRASAHMTGTLHIVDGGMTLKSVRHFPKDVAAGFKPRRDEQGRAKL